MICCPNRDASENETGCCYSRTVGLNWNRQVWRMAACLVAVCRSGESHEDIYDSVTVFCDSLLSLGQRDVGLVLDT